MTSTKQSAATKTNNGNEENEAEKAGDHHQQQPAVPYCANVTVPTNSTQRANKPKPLILNANNEHQKANHHPSNTSTTTTTANATPRSAANTQQQTIRIDELLELMQTVNQGVKAGQFTRLLGDQIVSVCHQLKLQGDQLEKANKVDLNRVFVSLRQACCRDNGQLGTACRLKIMELVELRAMGWRPSLAHSQYYLNRQQPAGNNHGGSNVHMHQSAASDYAPVVSHAMSHSVSGQPFTGLINSTTASGTYLPAPLSVNSVQAFMHQQQQQQQALQQQQQHLQQQQQQHQGQPHQHNNQPSTQPFVTGQAPISAPPFGSVPMNPFGPPGMPPHPHMFHPGHPGQHTPGNMGHFEFGQQQHTPSYYLVPASAGFLPATSLGALMMGGGGPPSSPLGPPMSATHYGPPPMSAGIVGGMFANNDGSTDSPWPKGAVIKHGKFNRPQRIPGKSQFRDELIIKNADSGKIMGVKGRRVAVVEELSKTVISFQKVTPTSKERTLTLTGNTEEQIDYAKLLIEETIKRNVSPNRQGDGDENGIREEENEEDSDSSDVFDDPAEAADKLAKVKFETNDDGSLKLSCADPAVLQAAQDALSQFFVNQVPMRKSSEQKTPTGERRKSVPSFSPEAEGASAGERKGHASLVNGQSRALRGSMHILEGDQSNQLSPSEADKVLNWRNNQQRRVRTRSVPNLAEVNTTPLPPPPAPQIRARYTRDYLLQCADAPASHQAPDCNDHLAVEAPDIMRTPKQFLESKEYKICSGALMQSLKSPALF